MTSTPPMASSAQSLSKLVLSLSKRIRRITRISQIRGNFRFDIPSIVAQMQDSKPIAIRTASQTLSALMPTPTTVTVEMKFELFGVASDSERESASEVVPYFDVSATFAVAYEVMEDAPSPDA